MMYMLQSEGESLLDIGLSEADLKKYLQPSDETQILYQKHLLYQLTQAKI